MPVWVDGRIVPDGTPVVPAFDRGFLYGDGLFETVRVQDGVCVWLDEHAERLAFGCKALAIPMPPPELVQDAAKRLSKESAGRHRLRIVLTRGPGPAGYAPPPAPKPALFLTLEPASVATSGVSLTVRRAESAFPTLRVKSLSQLESVRAASHARGSGAHDALLTDASGRVVESTSANVFAVLDGSVATPPLADGPLPGITRAHVLQLARTNRIPVAERSIRWADLARASEIFLTSSVAGVVPVVSIDGSTVRSDAEGSTTKRLQDLLEEEIGSSVRNRLESREN